MIRRLFKTGNSVVVALPREALETLGLHDGAEVSLELDRERGGVFIAPAGETAGEVDPLFARQVAEFIEQYRPALEALARA